MTHNKHCLGNRYSSITCEDAGQILVKTRPSTDRKYDRSTIDTVRKNKQHQVPKEKPFCMKIEPGKHLQETHTGIFLQHNSKLRSYLQLQLALALGHKLVFLLLLETHHLPLVQPAHNMM